MKSLSGVPIDLAEELLHDALFNESGTGICLECHETQSGVEPDAQGYTCECCGQPAVCGPYNLL